MKIIKIIVGLTIVCLKVVDSHKLRLSNKIQLTENLKMLRPNSTAKSTTKQTYTSPQPNKKTKTNLHITPKIQWIQSW